MYQINCGVNEYRWTTNCIKVHYQRDYHQVNIMLAARLWVSKAFCIRLVTSWTMNTSNSTCKSAGSTTQQDLVPVWFCILLIVLNAVILIGSAAGFSLLLRYILSSPKKGRTPNHTFFFCISIVSLLGLIIGKYTRISTA